MAATTMLSVVDGATHHRPVGLASHVWCLLAQGGAGATIGFQHNFHIHAQLPIASAAAIAAVITSWYVVHLIPRASPGGVCLGIPAACLLPTVETRAPGRVVLNTAGAIYRSWDIVCELIHTAQL